MVALTLPVLVWVELTMTVLLLPSVTTTRLLPMADAPPERADAGDSVERAGARRRRSGPAGLDHAVDDTRLPLASRMLTSTGWFSSSESRP